MNNKIDVFVNQLGYAVDKTKHAYARGLKGGEEFELLSGSKVVYTGKANLPIEDRVAGEAVCRLDFSDFKSQGSYFIRLKDGKKAVESLPFKIADGLYDDIYYASLKYFYLSRCGIEIDQKSGGVWAHPACHNTPALIYGTDKKIDVNGGWHDAGDYGRYIVAASKAVMDLLLAYDAADKEQKFDILGEVRFELEWMLKMQRQDGGVFHKVSCYHFCAFINPHEEKDELVISPVSSTATADFAGSCAFASLFYKKTNPAFAKKLLEAARKAQAYLDTHEEELFRNPPEITTGGYGDWTSSDERYFAYAALFLTDGDQSYLDKALELRQKILDTPEDPQFPWKNKWFEGFGWGMVSGYGSELFLRAKDKIKDKAKVKLLEESMTASADRILERVKNASFGTSMDKVHWGSCGHVCDDAHALLLAYDITGKKDYYEAAKNQFDYLLGCNPMNICYITGFGTNTVKHPHHRPSGATGKTMPGMLSGGPCEGLYDACAKEKLGPLNPPPLRCFIDDEASYSTNEIAIYWNSTFVYIASKLKMV